MNSTQTGNVSSFMTPSTTIYSNLSSADAEYLQNIEKRYPNADSSLPVDLSDVQKKISQEMTEEMLQFKKHKFEFRSILGYRAMIGIVFVASMIGLVFLGKEIQHLKHQGANLQKWVNDSSSRSGRSLVFVHPKLQGYFAVAIIGILALGILVTLPSLCSLIGSLLLDTAQEEDQASKVCLSNYQDKKKLHDFLTQSEMDTVKEKRKLEIQSIQKQQWEEKQKVKQQSEKQKIDEVCKQYQDLCAQKQIPAVFDQNTLEIKYLSLKETVDQNLYTLIPNSVDKFCNENKQYYESLCSQYPPQDVFTREECQKNVKEFLDQEIRYYHEMQFVEAVGQPVQPFQYAMYDVYNGLLKKKKVSGFTCEKSADYFKQFLSPDDYQQYAEYCACFYKEQTIGEARLTFQRDALYLNSIKDNGHQAAMQDQITGEGEE